MKNRRTVCIELTQIEVKMIANALKGYANDTQNEMSYPEYEELAKEIQEIEFTFAG